ncbi:MAG: hypothetical protein WAW02_11875 [Sideroxyarcus sp.]
MGVAYFIEVDKDELVVIGDIDGKAVAKAMDDLTILAEELGLPPLDSFMGQSMDDMSDLLGEDIEMEEGTDGAAKWFEPAAGIKVIDGLLKAMTEDPKRIKNSKQVAEDLVSYRNALSLAVEAGANWHLAIDF